MKPIIKEKKAKKKFFNWPVIYRYLRTFFKNDACVECSIVPRKKNNYTGAKYWWISIPVFLAAITLAMTPLTVHASQVTGASYFAQRTYDIDQALYDATTKEESNDAFVDCAGELGSIVFENGKALFEATNTEKNYYVEKDPAGFTLVGFHNQLVQDTKDPNSFVKKKNFEVFYINEKDNKKANKVVDYLVSNTVKILSDNTIDRGIDVKAPRDCSFMAFTPNELTIYVHNAGTNGQPIKIVGDYKHIANGKLGDILLKTKDSSELINVDLVMKNFKGFADDVYENTRVALTAGQSGISLAVNGGITILLGFIMFFLTRGKQNPNRYIKWYETLNMAMWASFLPGLIALVFGFIFPGMEMMLFLISFGFRSMWLSMRNLRPQAY